MTRSSTKILARVLVTLGLLFAVNGQAEDVTAYAYSVSDPLNDRLLGIQNAMPVNNWGRGTMRGVTYPDGSTEVAIKVNLYSSAQWSVVVGTQLDANGNPVPTQGSTVETGGVTEESINGEGGSSSAGSPISTGYGGNPWQGGWNNGGAPTQGACGFADGNYQCVYYNPGFP